MSLQRRTNVNQFYTVSRLTVLLTLSVGLTAQAGDLDPPSGQPQPTMKTLQQVEPRIPISSIPIHITESGSYYLTQNLVLLEEDDTYGIAIEADNVTLDLKGFTLTGGGDGTIGMPVKNGQRITVRNGCLRNWGQAMWMWTVVLQLRIGIDDLG